MNLLNGHSDSARLAVNRYGHHDHECEEYDHYSDKKSCSCGFNQALAAAFRGDDNIPVRPTVYRRPK